jgi:TolB protein
MYNQFNYKRKITMKTIITFLFTIFLTSMVFSQTMFVYPKNNPTPSSFVISDIDSITFSTSNDPIGTAKLVYHKSIESASKIFISNLDGTDEQQLTTGTSNDYQPKFNYSRTKIVFVSDRDGQYDVYTMDIDGTNIIRVTTTGTHGGQNGAGSAAWTGDGKIVYTLNDTLYKINIDGSNSTPIYTAPPDRGIHSVLTSQSFNKIVVQIQSPWGGYDVEHVAMNIDGSDSKEVVPNDPGGLSLGGFSPDGNKCLYSWDTTGHEESSGRSLEHHIYILNLTSNTKIDISSGLKPDGSNDLHPIFTPDGNKILFINMQNDSDNFALYIMNLDGTGRTKIRDNVSWLVDSR